MKRITLLLLPIVAFAIGAQEAPAPKSREEKLGLRWQESLTAEANGDTSMAMASLTNYAKNGGDSYLFNLRAGWLNFSAKKYDEAAVSYAAASKIQPNSLSALLGLLCVAQARNDVPAAARAGEMALVIEPTNYRALMAVGWASLLAKDYPRAGSAYQRVLAHYPEDPDAISGAAWSAFYTGQKQDAQLLFRRLMTVNPGYSDLQQGLAATTK